MMHRIPTAKPHNFVPKRIYHYILSFDVDELRQNAAGNFSLPFIIKKPDKNPPNVKDGGESEVIEYVENLLSIGILNNDEKIIVSPFDMTFQNQCWIVIQIESKINNWQFSVDDYGLTTKVDSDRHCSLRHVENGKVQPAGERVKDDGCRVLYFGIVARAGKGHVGASELFNFHTEFLTPGLDEQGKPITKRLKVIFDPDIKNEGSPIPP